MITTDTDQKKEYYIIARQIVTQEQTYDYEFCEDAYIAIPDRVILLTDEEYALLRSRLYCTGNHWVLIPVANPAILDVSKLIEEQRVFEAEEAVRRAKAQKEREEAAAKAKELRDAKKELTAAKAREKKLKDLEKLKKELGVE